MKLQNIIDRLARRMEAQSDAWGTPFSYWQERAEERLASRLIDLCLKDEEIDYDEEIG